MRTKLTLLCDEDCRDLDLRLYDENDNLVGADTKRDDKPVITITPRWTARFRLEVTMDICVDAPCRYGVGVFGQ